jgi:hypothetical protein
MGPLLGVVQRDQVIQIDLARARQRNEPLARQVLVPGAILALDAVSLVAHERFRNPPAGKIAVPW